MVISLETAGRQALEFGHSFHREVAYLTVHGVLHLLGYQHQEEEERRRMRQKEEEILTLLNLPSQGSR
ncbi:MAG: Endoribonuclease YbeY [Firmicutes bacterium ADurb.Bin456]|nr:MAG: Endoribonuclease YbeY [Firmicutes bacterium ADurb.Bin456]